MTVWCNFEEAILSVVPNLRVPTPTVGRQSFTVGSWCCCILRGVRKQFAEPSLSACQSRPALEKYVVKEELIDDGQVSGGKKTQQKISLWSLGTGDLDHLLLHLLLAVLMASIRLSLNGFILFLLLFVMIIFPKEPRPTATSLLTYFRHLGPRLAFPRQCRW